MDVVQVVHEIGGHDHAGVLDVPRRAGLREPERRQRIGVRHIVRRVFDVFEGRDLHEVEGKIALVPQLAPAADKGGHFRVVVGIAAVGFALIPECAAHRESGDGRDHSVVKHGGRGVWNLVGAKIGRGGFCERGHGCKTHRRRPRLDARPAPGRFNKSDRDVQVGVEGKAGAAGLTQRTVAAGFFKADDCR